MVRAILAGRKTQTRRLATSPLAKALPGDRLWVRETCGWHWANDDLKPTAIAPDDWSIFYPADDHMTPAKRDGSVAGRDQIKRLRPSIHMPRWASRITLAISDVRHQRLQEMREADCIAEGAKIHGDIDFSRGSGFSSLNGPMIEVDGQPGTFVTPRWWFRELWDSLHDKAGERWDDNPEIVALTFSVALANIDSPEARHG